MSKPVTLLVNGVDYGGWTRVRVSRSLDFLATTFELEVASESEFNLSDWALRLGDTAEVYYGGSSLAARGIIEDIDSSYDNNSHTFRVSGRNAMGDIVDCHRPGEPKSWSRMSVSQLVRALVTPHGVNVSIDPSATVEAQKRVDAWSYNEGETVFDAIKRLCAKNGLLPVSHGDATIVLTKLGIELAADRIVRGVNVLTGAIRQSNRERFSDYHAKGFGFSLDTKRTIDYIQPKGDARDSVVGRYRPFVIVDEGASTSGSCKDRAKWEAQLRAGNSRTHSYVLQGWEQSNGALWKLNTNVQVEDPTYDVNGVFLINTIGFESSGSGSFVALGLVSPQKYSAAAKLDSIKTSFDISSLLGG